jgi:hypothetical protein
MPRYGRYIKDTIAYDPRSGFKVRLEDMVEDGETPGLMVAFDEADKINMQRYPAKFFPEGVLHKAFPPNERNDITMAIGKIYSGDPDFALILMPTALGGSDTRVDTFLSSTVVVTYQGVNVTYNGEPVTYTEVEP